ncbi:hypothetical protein GCM10023074_29650 [Microbispora amethystogenes]|uniref:Uncharacterized protein n=1 Tax=Microbispora amethystogenes TaxID=1427754 RepID=A0ABQ4FAD4_9ACTN|nr:hypothetical protein Mam01_19120 [Microbispora amethystogenes]
MTPLPDHALTVAMRDHEAIHAARAFRGFTLLLTHFGEVSTLSPEAVSRCPVVVRGAEGRHSRRPHGVRSPAREHGVQR